MEPSAFISYSHADQKWLDRLEKMLVPLVRGGLDIWSDKQIKPGDDWRKTIEDQLSKATVAVLLVSSDFIASDFIHKNELPPLLKAAHQKGLRVLWVPISDSLYERTPIGSYQAAHTPKSPLSGLKGRAAQDKALKQIALEIEHALTQSPAGSSGNPEASPQSSLSSHFSGLSGPESIQQPLASLRQDHGHLPVARVIKCLGQAIAGCYPGQSLSDRYPDLFADRPTTWDALELYFSDSKGIEPKLLSAWRAAVQEDEAPADNDVSVTVALVLEDHGVKALPYTTYRFVTASQKYECMSLSGNVQWNPKRPELTLAEVSAIIEKIIGVFRGQPESIGCIEIFVPWQLIALDWMGHLKIKDPFGDLVSLASEFPFVVRSADRIRLATAATASILHNKTSGLHSGEGKWLPAASAGHPDRLRVVDTQDDMVALHSHSPQRGAVDAEKWLKSLLKSMVPLALWTMPSRSGDDMAEDQFFACLWSLGLMEDGVKESPCPQCNDLLRLPIKRREALPCNDVLRQVHLLIDTPHQPRSYTPPPLV